MSTGYCSGDCSDPTNTSCLCLFGTDEAVLLKSVNLRSLSAKSTVKRTRYRRMIMKSRNQSAGLLSLSTL